ncbi:MAG: glycosyltransferase [Leptospirales bacterium]
MDPTNTILPPTKTIFPLTNKAEMNHPIKVLLPWNTSNFIPLNAFHPIYRFIIENQPKSTSVPVGYFAFNEKLLLESQLASDKGGILSECLESLARRLRSARNHDPEYHEVWDFFDINETLAGEISRADIQVLHTTPLTVGMKPFIYHLESFETLFYPWTIFDPFLMLSANGKVQSILEYLKRLLEDPKCLAIVSHLPSTLEKFKGTFPSDSVQTKLFHCPLGFPVSKRTPTKRTSFRFLYTSSLHKNLNNMERRGFRIVLRFMEIWLEKYPEDEFILLVPTLEDHDFPDLGISKIFANPRVYNFGNQYLSENEFESVLTTSDFMLMPSYQLHSASLLKSMGAGVIPVVSDLNSVIELGVSSKNSVVLDVFSKLDLAKSPVFGGIPSLRGFIAQSMAISEEMVRQLEFLKKNPEKKAELSHNAQNLIGERYNLDSASRQFSNLIIEIIGDIQKRSTVLNDTTGSERASNTKAFHDNLFGSPENLVPLRPVILEDFDTVPLYRPFLNLGSLNIHSNGQHFLIDDYNHSKLRGYPSLLSNNNGRVSFMSDWEQNLMGLLNPERSNKSKWGSTLKVYLRNFPRLKKFLKKIGINRIARKIGLI